MGKKVKFSTSRLVNSSGQTIEQQINNNLSQYVKSDTVSSMIASSAIHDANTVYGVANATSDGLMSTIMFNKLNNIEERANNYSLPVATTKSLGGIIVGSNLSVNAGVLNATNTTYQPGSNVIIKDGYIHAVDTTYSAGPNIVIGTDRKISAVIPSGSGSGVTYQQGSNIVISGNIISAKDTTYTAGSNVTISNNVISAKDTTYSVATANADGLMSKSDFNKLKTIASSANNYTLPAAKTNALGGIMVGSNLSITAAGVLNATNTTYTQGSNITISNNVIAAKDTTYTVANDSANGLMSKSDFSKLKTIASSANNYTLPAATKDKLGGIIVGSNLAISAGVLSATFPTATSKVAGVLKLYTDCSGSATDGAVTQKAVSAAIANIGKNLTVDKATSASVANSAVIASSANQLTTARTISLTGYVAGSVKFDGKSNVTIATSCPGTVLSAADYGYIASSSLATLPNNLATGIYVLNASRWNDMPLINVGSESRCMLEVKRSPSGNAIWMVYATKKKQVYYAYQDSITSQRGSWGTLDQNLEIINASDLNTVTGEGFFLVQRDGNTWSNAPSGYTTSTIFIKNEGSNVKFTMSTGTGTFSIVQTAYSNDANTNVWIRKYYNASKWSPWIKIGEASIPEASTTTAGLMSADMVKKLNNIASNANNYSLPTANASTLGGIKVGTNLTITNGVLSATNTTYSQGTSTTLGLVRLYTGTGTNTNGTMTQKAITDSFNTHSTWISSINLTGAVTGTAKIASNKVSIATTAAAANVTLPTTKPSNPSHGALYVDMTNHAIMVYDSAKKNWLVTRNP